MPRVRGRVVSGRANFGFWIERLNTFYAKKTGMQFYPGTLNIELPAPYSLPLNVMRLEANEYGGTVSVNIVPCQIFDRKAFLLRTDRNNTVQDITRGTSSKSLRMFGCVMPINLRTEIG